MSSLVATQNSTTHIAQLLCLKSRQVNRPSPDTPTKLGSSGWRKEGNQHTAMHQASQSFAKLLFPPRIQPSFGIHLRHHLCGRRLHFYKYMQATLPCSPSDTVHFPKWLHILQKHCPKIPTKGARRVSPY